MSENKKNLEKQNYHESLLAIDLPRLEFSVPESLSSLLSFKNDLSNIQMPKFEIATELSDIFGPIKDAFNSFNSIFNSTIKDLQKQMELIKDITAPIIMTEGDFILRMDRSEKYGSMLWTDNPNEHYHLYDMNEEQFKKITDRWKKGKDFTETIEAIKYNCVKKLTINELDEANSCFHNKEYRACAGILLSIIDGEISRFVKSKFKKYKYVQSTKARKNAFNNISEKDATTLLNWAIIKSAYDKLYHETDFKKRSVPLSRHSVQHGMNTSKVSKTFCIQLSYFLWNFINFTEDLKDNNGKLTLFRLKSIVISKTSNPNV